jgi:hypothetical protein
MVEGLGGVITGYLRNLGAVAVRMAPSVAPALSRHPLVDYVEPRQKLELDGVPIGMAALAVQGSQTQPCGPAAR